MATTSWVTPIDGPPISSQDRAIPIRKQHDDQDRDRLHGAGDRPAGRSGPSPAAVWITKITASPTRNSASRTVLQVQLAQPDQRQQRRRHERDPGCAHRHRGRPDHVPRDQREQRDRRARRGTRSAPAAARMRCTWAPSPGQPPGRDRDGHEQQPDQRTGHAGATQEEVMNVVRNHPTIQPAGRCTPRTRPSAHRAPPARPERRAAAAARARAATGRDVLRAGQASSEGDRGRSVSGR